MNGCAFIRSLNHSQTVGCHTNQLLRAGEYLLEVVCGLLDAWFNPLISPAHEVGCESGEMNLDLDASRAAAHQVLDFEGSLLLLDAGLNGLTAIRVYAQLAT